MDIQLRDIVGSEEVLVRMFKARPEHAKTTFRIAQLKRAVNPAFEDYFAARVELLKKYAHLDDDEKGRYMFIQADDDGKPLLDAEGNEQRDGEAIEAFQTAHNELLDEEVEVAVKPLTLTIIDNIGLDPALSVEEMNTIFWLIKE